MDPTKTMAGTPPLNWAVQQRYSETFDRLRSVTHFEFDCLVVRGGDGGHFAKFLKIQAL